MKLRPLLIVAALALGSCERPPRPEDPANLSFLLDRERWQATRVSARMTRIDAGDGRVETTLAIVAEGAGRGERLTFLVLADELMGTHDLKVFGNLGGFADGGGATAVTNACASSDPSSTSGSLSVEAHDPELRRLSGSFIANVCDLQDAADAKTLGDGTFDLVRY